MEGQLLRLWLRNRTGVDLKVLDSFGGGFLVEIWEIFGFLLFCLKFEVLWF